MSATDPLCLVGPGTIAGIVIQRERLSDAIAEGDVTLNLSSVEHADVTLVQLVLSARASAALRNRTLTVLCCSTAASEVFMRAGVPLESLAPSPSLAD